MREAHRVRRRGRGVRVHRAGSHGRGAVGGGQGPCGRGPRRDGSHAGARGQSEGSDPELARQAGAHVPPAAEIVDEELAARAAAGDAAAFETLVSRTRGGSIGSPTGSPGATRTPRTCSRTHSWRPTGTSRPSGARSLLHLALSHRHERRPDAPAGPAAAADGIAGGVLAAVRRERAACAGGRRAGGGEPDRRSAGWEAPGGESPAAWTRLPDLYREAFVLRDLEELDTDEVATSSVSTPPRCDSACIGRG